MSAGVDPRSTFVPGNDIGAEPHVGIFIMDIISTVVPVVGIVIACYRVLLPQAVVLNSFVQ